MHLVLSFAGAASEPAAQAASGLSLPHLERLLARLSPVHHDPGDALSLSPPHERALAAAWGWPVVDGLLPMAAQAATADGLAPPDDGRGLALIHPVHWHLGTEQVSLADPGGLDLGEDEARALFEALRPLAEDDGFALLWGAPTRWYAAHASFASLPSASLDRVIGRNVDLWLNSHADARRVRRLQAEAQMLWHTHAVNAQREARGALPVNSFWLSGTGLPRAVPTLPDLQADHSLRGPALAEDWAAWAEAWAALDAGPLRELLQRTEQQQPVALTLCGESHAQRWELRPRGWKQRWFGPRRADIAKLLHAL